MATSNTNCAQHLASPRNHRLGSTLQKVHGIHPATIPIPAFSAESHGGDGGDGGNGAGFDHATGVTTLRPALVVTQFNLPDRDRTCSIFARARYDLPLIPSPPPLFFTFLSSCSTQSLLSQPISNFLLEPVYRNNSILYHAFLSSSVFSVYASLSSFFWTTFDT